MKIKTADKPQHDSIAYTIDTRTKKNPKTEITIRTHTAKVGSHIRHLITIPTIITTQKKSQITQHPTDQSNDQTTYIYTYQSGHHTPTKIVILYIHTLITIP